MFQGERVPVSGSKAGPGQGAVRAGLHPLRQGVETQL